MEGRCVVEEGGVVERLGMSVNWRQMKEAVAGRVGELLEGVGDFVGGVGGGGVGAAGGEWGVGYVVVVCDAVVGGGSGVL